MKSRIAIYLLLLILVAWGVWQPGKSVLVGEEIHVSPDGCDYWLGDNQSRAVRTLQHAVDIAQPGDTILVWPGIYRESVRIRRGGAGEARVVIRAVVPGEAVVSNLARPETVAALEWIGTNRFYSCTPPWPVYLVRLDGAQLFRVPWGGREALAKYVERAHAEASFHWDGRSLTIGFPSGWEGDVNAALRRIEINSFTQQGREWGEFKSANLWIEAGDIDLDGLVFDFGVGAGINVWDGERVSIRNCLFTGAQVGVQASWRAGSCAGLHLENCAYHHFPLGRWRGIWLSWKEVYAAYSTQSLLACSDANLRARRNLVVDAADGMKVSPATRGERSSLVEENVYYFGTDDAIEADGPGINLLIRSNIVDRFHTGFSLSPLTEGPTQIVDNLVCSGNRVQHDVALKFLVPAGQENSITNVSIRRNRFFTGLLAYVPNVPMIGGVSFSENYLFYHWPKEVWQPDGFVSRGANTVERGGIEATRAAGERERASAVRGLLATGGIGPNWLEGSDSRSWALGVDRRKREIITGL